MILSFKPLQQRLIHYFNLFLVCLLLLSGLQATVQAAENGEPLQIQSVLYSADSRTVSLVAQEGAQYSSEFNVVKLSHPYRAVVDIPKAYLSTPTRTIPVRQNGIEQIELSQSLGTFYQGVRLTIYAATAEAIGTIQVQPQKNSLLITLAAATPASPELAQPPLPSIQSQHSFLDNAPPPDRNIIQSVLLEGGVLTVTAASSSALIVKNQFTLKNPSRLVIDLANAVLADKRLTTPVDSRSGTIKSVRLGQFSEDTVRVVVETPNPASLYLVYPGETRNQIALTPYLNRSIATLPGENQKIGFIKDVFVSKQDHHDVIRISTSDPMVRRITRQGNHIQVELINIASRSSFISYDKQQFPDIREVRLDPLNPSEPNTKLTIKLENPHVDMDSHLSLDGRSLDIVLSPRYRTADSSSRMPSLVIPRSSVKKGLYTVVVDAGHGGKDRGANRVGVNEKQLNLSVALKLKQALEERGVTVHITRATDIFLELSQITAITNRIRPDAFVSVHTNASVNPSINGLETYYYTPQSKDLAARVHKRLVNSIGSPDRGVRTARFYVIHHTAVPAILCEMGYISNPSERESLQSEARQRATAEAIAEGVVEFLERKYKAEAPEGAEP